ncbi:MAG: DUF4292 domain-containing protein [Saprospiraceae bacterium]|nr:DUF4292 domain-containing protein [Saprospiraceae bacterium]
MGRTLAAGKWTLILMVLFAFGMGCKGKNKRVGEKDLNLSWSSLQPKLEANRNIPERLNVKAKVKYRDEYGAFQFTSNLRIVGKDLIWLNASFLGFEVARVLVRPDSVFAINRWDKIYMADAIENMRNVIDVDMTYPQLLDILLGNPVIWKDSVSQFALEAEQYYMEQASAPYEIQQQVDPTSFLPSRLFVRDTKSKYTFDADLTDHRAVNDSFQFSYFRDYIISSDNVQLSRIQINILDVDTKQVKKTPFSIPRHYERL